ncbi:MAG: phosphate-starvation-inducible PsiE family protein [Deltaproteobacteria bacterium]|nr:phosphate-starvation-inducible PsiE family protein [Deltaproteobacteria bacterium]
MQIGRMRRFWGSQTSVGMAGILQNLQNIIVVAVCLLMFWIMLVQIYQTSLETLETKNFRAIAGHLIYIFVLIELFRLMIYYLEEQRILLGSIIEVTVVSILREIILEGVLNVSLDRLLGVCGLILTLTLTLALYQYLEKGRAKLEQITIPKPAPRA